MRPHPDTELGVDFLDFLRVFQISVQEPKTRNQDVKPECTNNGHVLDAK